MESITDYNMSVEEVQPLMTIPEFIIRPVLLEYVNFMSLSRGTGSLTASFDSFQYTIENVRELFNINSAVFTAELCREAFWNENVNVLDEYFPQDTHSPRLV